MSGNSYSAGQAGAMGPRAHAHDMTFQQIWNQSAAELDLAALARELSALRGSLKSTATTPDHDVSVGEVAAAEAAAAKGDGPTVLRHLKNAGSWVLETALRIGLETASTAIQRAIGS